MRVDFTGIAEKLRQNGIGLYYERRSKAMDGIRVGTPGLVFLKIGGDYDGLTGNPASFASRPDEDIWTYVVRARSKFICPSLRALNFSFSG
jgi:hypothetical protein